MLTHEDDGFMGQFIVQSPEIGIEERKSNGFQIYPNPSTGWINVKNEVSFGYLEYSLTDVFGKVVQEGTISRSQNRISLENLCSGLYFLRFESDSNVLKVHLTH
jgi:hypothetical protein